MLKLRHNVFMLDEECAQSNKGHHIVVSILTWTPPKTILKKIVGYVKTYQNCHFYFTNFISHAGLFKAEVMKKSLKWTPAQPIRKPDNIISSDARLRNDFGFKPSYLFTERSENMKFIMSNEYMRKWFKERDNYAQELFIRLQTEKEESGIKRRYVQRMLIHEKREKHMPIIKLKKFQNISSKSDYGQKRNGDSKDDNKDEKDENKSVKTAEKPNLSAPIKQAYQRYKPECVMPKKQKARNLQINPIVTNEVAEKTNEEAHKNLDSKNDTKKEGQIVKLLLPCGQCKCRCTNGLENEK